MRFIFAVAMLCAFVFPAKAQEPEWYQRVIAAQGDGGTVFARKGRAAEAAVSGGVFSGGLVAIAQRDLGKTARDMGVPGSLWCRDALNVWLRHAGYRTDNSRLARDAVKLGVRVSGPQVGAIAVMTRGRRGGHVGIVSGVDERGNPIIISGNHNRRVAEAVYPRGRVYAYVVPSS